MRDTCSTVAPEDYIVVFFVTMNHRVAIVDRRAIV
jgi:hypothetical protein